MYRDMNAVLLFIFLLLQVTQAASVQEIQTSHENIAKINSAAEMMQCSAVLDVLFLMDGSYSIGKGTFERAKHYAVKLCEALTVAPDKVRVGLIQFGSVPRLEFSLDSFSTKQELKKHLKKISYRGGSTQTGQALKYVLKKGFPGGRNSSSVPRVAILLSDGRSQGSVVQAAAQLKQTGVVLFAVGLRYPKYSKVYKTHQTVCHRTVCSDPCDSQPCLNGGTCVSQGLERYHCVCPPGYGSDPHCAPALSLDCSIDLLFLLEGSATLTLEGFLRLKSFLKRFLQAVIGSDSPSKVGLAVFGGETRVEAQVGRFNGNTRNLLKAVDALQPPGGLTLTGQALRHVTRHGFVSEPVFADVSDDLPRVVVLLAATPAADDVVEASKYARDREIFLIGVGPERLKAELNNITGNPQRTLTYSSPDRLIGKIPELKAKICSVDTQGCLGQAVDLVFALDASVGVGRENFATLQDFVRSISVQFDVNRDVAQVALVAYNRRATTVFGLDEHESGSAILKAVGEASYMGGGVSTGAALLHIYSKVLTVANGARPGVNKAVVVVTDGSGGDDAVVPAQKIRDSGVSVFVVGIGDMQRDKVLMISGSEEYMISAPSYEDLKYFEDVLVQMVCSEVRKPVNLCKPNPCMHDGICVLSGASFRCRCHGYEGPHCQRRSGKNSSRGDVPKPAGLRKKSRQRKSHQELLRRYKLHRRRHAA
ncbi:von Willebrand factor A domain-containing protein 2 isoform X3 [Poecilia reticulata]|uniref:von Willebrand factor A domain-containing protein 2 isoform X3 n=1 Tax=Poecilia reticulata TaxID=8081 RepID=UPI0004A28E93|nr:PREDICTED: von Willebrand factor A domain-containing protein 2 isoform X3 [Poecilia reticulata]